MGNEFEYGINSEINSGSQNGKNLTFLKAEEIIKLNIDTSTLTQLDKMIREQADYSQILWNDGLSSYFLGEDNLLYNPSTGSVLNKISVEGDCYNALATEELTVSYEKVVSQTQIME